MPQLAPSIVSRHLLGAAFLSGACAPRYEPLPVQPPCKPAYAAAPSLPARPDSAVVAPGELAVRMVWNERGEPVLGMRAQVSALPAEGSAPWVAADSLGRVRFAGLAPGGAYVVRVRALGFPARADTVAIAGGRGVALELPVHGPYIDDSCHVVVVRRRAWWKVW